MNTNSIELTSKTPLSVACVVDLSHNPDNSCNEVAPVGASSPTFAPTRTDVLEKMQAENNLARHSHPSAKQLKKQGQKNNASRQKTTVEPKQVTMSEKNVSVQKPVDLTDESIWESMPLTNPLPPAVMPSFDQPLIALIDRQMDVPRSEHEQKDGYSMVKSDRIEMQGNPELFLEAQRALQALHAKPSGGTFFVTQDGVTKEYYRAQFGLCELLRAGRQLAKECKYPNDITASIEAYQSGVAYACITFRKRIDHAQKTYLELGKKWSIPVQKPLSFAVPLKAFGTLASCFGYGYDSDAKIEQMEKHRDEVFAKFIQDSHDNGMPADPAIARIYRPTPDERVKLIGLDPEYIAATDCVMFVYKEVEKSPQNTGSTDTR